MNVKQRDDWHLTEDLHHQLGRGDPFAAAVRSTRMPMIITNPALPDHPIVFANEAFQELTGYPRDEIVGRNCRFLQGPDTDPAAVAKIRDAIAAGESVTVDILNYRRNGTAFWNALHVSPVRNDDGEIAFYFASQINVTERMADQKAATDRREEVEREVEKRTAELKQALDDKTLLLHEVDHRVKNNIAMIGSLLRMQVRTLNDPDTVAKLTTMLERVDALATVHRRLYQSDDIRRFDIGAFSADLASDVLGAAGRDDIRLATEVDIVEVPSSFAAPVGLVVNEILTNAVKHGYRDGRPGVVNLRVVKEGNAAVVEVADDGHGLPEASPKSSGLGRTLITRLSRQVGATVDWSDARPGTRVTVTVPLSE